MRHIPRHPLLMARFASSALYSAFASARSHFGGRGLEPSSSTHSILPLESAGGCIDPPKKVIEHNEIVEAHQAIPLKRFWPLGLMTFVVLVGAAAQFTGLHFLLFPPVIAMAYEIIGHPTAPDWVRRPYSSLSSALLTSTIDLLTYDLVQGTVLAVMVTILCSIIILRRFEVHMPPALAVGLLPFVIKGQTINFRTRCSLERSLWYCTGPATGAFFRC